MTEAHSAAEPGRGGGRQLFRAANMTVLLGYAAVIAALLLADLWYVDRESFRDAVGSPEIRSAFALSLVTSVVTTALAVLVAVPSAYALSRYRFRGAAAVDTVLDVSIILPPIVMGVSILVLYKLGRDLSESEVAGLSTAGALMRWIGERVIYGRAGIVLAQFLCSAAYAVRVIKASFDEVDPRSEAVALTLGATEAQAFRLVTLPQVKPGITAGAILAWARAIGIFGPVQIVAGAVRGRTLVLPTAIYFEFSVGELEGALAISLLMVAVCVAVLLAFRLLTVAPLWGAGGRGAREDGGGRP